MTMMQKMQAKKSKKGFTLVELVIVIAILAILAAIAIPVITTTINSSKKSTLQSDMTTVDMVLKEAVNTSLASIDASYGNANVKTATVYSVLVENGLASNLLDMRAIGGINYALGWDGTAVRIYSGVTGDNSDFVKASIASLTPGGASGTAITAGGKLDGTLNNADE